MKVSEEVMFLENAFDVLNERYFESALPKIAITIQSTPRAHGWNCQEMCSQRIPKICNRQVSGGMVSQPG